MLVFRNLKSQVCLPNFHIDHNKFIADYDPYSGDYEKEILTHTQLVTYEFVFTFSENPLPYHNFYFQL